MLCFDQGDRMPFEPELPLSATLTTTYSFGTQNPGSGDSSGVKLDVAILPKVGHFAPC